VSEGERRVFTVSELTVRLKAALEEAFPAVWVEGEISNLRTPGSGHAYFTLKDEGAQLSAVLFRGRGRRVRFDLEDGMQVLAFGGLDVYAARGQYQLVVEMMEPKGRAPARLRAAQAQARGGRPLRRGAQAAAPGFPARDRHRHVAHGRRHPRHP
jgi:exodeoxyribonuclease VII large subunit